MARLADITTASITVSVCFVLLVASAAVVEVESELDATNTTAPAAAAAATGAADAGSSSRDMRNADSDDIESALYEEFERFRALLSASRNHLEMITSVEEFDHLWDDDERESCSWADFMISHMIKVADNILDQMDKLRGEFFARHKLEEFMECYNSFLKIIGDKPRGLFRIIQLIFWSREGGKEESDLIMISINNFFKNYRAYWSKEACKSFYERPGLN